MERSLNAFRLNADNFVRPDLKKAEAKSIIFIASEGTETEPDYFNHLNEYLLSQHPECPFRLQPLRHDQDTDSDPRHVLELLETCNDLRQGRPLLTESKIAKRLDEKLLRQYFEQPLTLSRAKRDAIESAITKLGINVSYFRFLKEIGGKSMLGTDRFAIVIDRDRGCHKIQTLIDIRNACRKKHFAFCLSNPCFDLWLLLHLNFKLTASSRQKLLANRHTSSSNTYSSVQVARLAHHTKSIGASTFNTLYLPKIRTAVKRAQSLGTTDNTILTRIGSMVPTLLEPLTQWL